MTVNLFGLVLGLALGLVAGWLIWGRGTHGSGQAPAEPAELPGRHAADPAGVELARVAEAAATHIGPLHEAIGRLSGQIADMEKERAQALGSLASQIQTMTRTSYRLSDRTDKLVASLRSPQVRGRWGEMQLGRVVELGGMVEHCDFDVQVPARVNGKLVKPDMVIRLSGGRNVVVDAKVPYSAYLDALETTDPEEHAAFLRRHVTELSRRDYIEAFSPTPEFIVLFVPADPFLDAALNVDPELMEFGLAHSVVIATPTTLFALLRTVSLGWRQEDYSQKAREIHRLGREFYTRLTTLTEHYAQVGKALDRAVEAYNASLGSVDARVGVTARKLAEMGVPAHTDRTAAQPQPASRPRPASPQHLQPQRGD
ncbi:DNA recombination protein RmuC [Corynebacterium atypicum]|uniref:DNA recombination protein RmuC n=1 Tax=Corynebacterium atypicum TaxID=191610 RepID=UPI00056EE095|nr:DNA recombination protein RmuC [Corynebacterium atypicum]